jgi:penicillin-binding protein 1A
MIGEPPDSPEEDEADELGPDTFRADLLHHRAWAISKGRRVLIAAGAAFLLLALVGMANAWRFFLGDLPSVPASAASLTSLNREPGLTFLDRNGALIATRGPKYGLKVALADLPPYVPRAFLAAEDRRFYVHGAVDWRAVGRALGANLGAGRTVEGASTISQQLARDLFLGRQRTLKRKVQEIVLAGKLYRQLGRGGVLELYLNRVYLGENAFGVDAAARTYFGKPARSLTLAEAAVLAGLPQAPSTLDPTDNAAAALKRGRLVLNRMVAEHWITPAQAAAAARQPVVLIRPRPEGDFGWVFDLAARQARDKARGEADLVVRLTVDQGLQVAAARALRETLDGEGRRLGASQGAVVLLAPDGAIRALVGGRDRMPRRADLRGSEARRVPDQFNRATDARRQPGSAFKPFVWAAALESGVASDAEISTAPVGPGAQDDHSRAAALSLTEALAQSNNNVAQRLALQAGLQRVAALARRFGVTIDRRLHLSLALGAYETTLLELTTAYQPFQQGGVSRGSYLVEEVLGSDGRVIWRRPTQAPRIVYDSSRAGAMLRMMTAVVDHGTGRRAAFGRPAAGKTGTTNDNRSAWFVGFTPDWLAGVWVGNDNNAPMRGVEGGTLPAEVWRRVMIAAHGDLPVAAFDAQLAEGAAAEGAETPDAVAAQSREAFYRTLASEFDRAARQ